MAETAGFAVAKVDLLIEARLQTVRLSGGNEGEKERRWKLPICTGCHGIIGYKLDGGCSCDPAHAKTGKSVEVLPVPEHEAALAKARTALGRIANGDVPGVSFAEPDLISEFAQAALDPLTKEET